MSFLTKIGRFAVKHKSGIFMTIGIGLGGGCIAATVVQTIKACDIIENANERMDNVEVDLAYTEDEKETRLKEIRKETNIALVKNYILPAGLGIGSLACILGAYKVVSDQKAAALTALASTTAAFEKYRSRVIEKYGAEADYELYNGTTTVTKETVDGKDLTTRVNNPINDNCYTKIFSFETSTEWKSTWKLNKAFLEFYERYWNEQLRRKGYVTYNEVIESLGFSRKVGSGMTDQFIPNGIGWVSDENVPDELDGHFDTFISFAPSDYGIDSETRTAIFDDPGYILRFNCYPIDGLLMRKADAMGRGEH